MGAVSASFLVPLPSITCYPLPNKVRPTKTGTLQPTTKPAWEIFFTDETARVVERPWEDRTTGKKGTTWDKRGALWDSTTKGGDATLRGKLTLPDGKEIRLALRKPRERKAKAA